MKLPLESAADKRKAAKDWKPKTRYDNIDDLNNATPQTHVLVLHREQKIVSVGPRYLKGSDHPADFVSVFKIDDDGSLKLMDTKKLIEELTTVLAEHITPSKLIEDVLKCTAPDDLMEIYERAVVKKGKVQESTDCYGLKFGGKPGGMFRLNIFDG